MSSLPVHAAVVAIAALMIAAMPLAAPALDWKPSELSRTSISPEALTRAVGPLPETRIVDHV
jgi:hypothetical protein